MHERCVESVAWTLVYSKRANLVFGRIVCSVMPRGPRVGALVCSMQSFSGGVGGHGSASSKKKIRMREAVWRKAKDAVDKRYERDYIRERVLDLNEATLTPRYPNVTAQN